MVASSKLVYPAEWYHKLVPPPVSWQKILKDGNFSMIASGRSGCLIEDTLIQTSHGNIPIKDCPSMFMVWSYNFKTGDKELKPVNKIKSGRKRLYKLIFDDKRSVIASEDHRFFVFDGDMVKEKRLGALNRGDILFAEDAKHAKIEFIKYYGEHETYDLKVADNHNFFLANGILTHNSGKDTLTLSAVNNDIHNGRTVIILDVKMEYPCAIFTQQDPTLRRLLIEQNRAGRGYKVNLWIPFVQGMEENKHFLELLNYHHPNLRIRPFRIFKPDLTSEDSANLAFSKTALQSMATKDNQLVGSTKVLNELREAMGRLKMGFDDENYHRPNCGWEYIDFHEMTSNKEINVISTFFMVGKTIVPAVSFMIGILNELMTIGKGTDRLRGERDVFSVVIPEVQIIMPKGVKSLEQVVNTLSYSMLVGLLLMRSFDVRLRINLQNLSSLNPDMVSQSRLFVGKTWNIKDLNLLSHFGIPKSERERFLHLKTGQFADLMGRKLFSVIPYCHKAREKEPFLQMLKDWSEDPTQFLFPTPNGYLTEIIDTQEIEGKFPMTLKEYKKRVKAWIKRQEPRPVPYYVDSPVESFEDQVDRFEEVVKELVS